jgi:DNA polymerase II large subunit
MQNKRKNSTLQNPIKKQKQSSLTNFFNLPKKEQETIKIEAETNKEKIETNEETLEIKTNEETIESEPNEEKEFYTSSMYTDEFSDMLETVLENESFLFTKEEINSFNTYRSLKGYFVIFTT